MNIVYFEFCFTHLLMYILLLPTCAYEEIKIAVFVDIIVSKVVWINYVIWSLQKLIEVVGTMFPQAEKGTIN